jgi:hypothetical protein
MEANHDFSALVFCDFTFNMPPDSFSPKEVMLKASDIAIEAALAIIRRILLSLNSAMFLWQDSRSGNCEVREVTDSHTYATLANSLVMLPAAPYDGEFTELFDEYYEDIKVERAIYIVTAALNDDLVETLRATGLIFRKNVILAVVPSPLNQQELVEYLNTRTQITVCQIQGDDEKAIESFNEGSL